MHVPVVLEPGPGWNQPAHGDVFLQAAQVIDPPRDGGLGQLACRLLERRGGDERLGRKRGLRDAEQQRPARRRAPAPRHDAFVLLHEPELVHLLIDEEFGAAYLFDLHPPHHLANDDFNVLVVDIHTLQPIDLLNLIDQVAVQRLLTEDAQDIVRVAWSIHQLLAGLHTVAFLHVDVHAARQRILTGLGARLVRHDDDLSQPLDDPPVPDRAIDLADDGGLSRLAGFEQLNHAW